MMNNFTWAAKTLFWISGASQAYLGSLKGCHQCGYYCTECLYSQISLKVWDSEEKLAFSLRPPLRRHIARLGMFSVNPGIVVSFYASAHHPYTTIAIDEWMIFWLSEDCPVEVGPTECSCHLVFESSLHVRLLPATLQFSMYFPESHIAAAVATLEWNTLPLFITLEKPVTLFEHFFYVCVLLNCMMFLYCCKHRKLFLTLWTILERILSFHNQTQSFRFFKDL